MTLARGGAAGELQAPDGQGALELQRFANAGRLLAAISDDLLRAIGMAHSDVAFLREQLAAGAGARDAADDAHRSLSRAAARVDALLSVNRAREPQVAEVRLAEVAESALFDVTACFAGLSLDRELDPQARALADRGALLQSLVSILLDAAEAAHRRVRILARGVEVVVEDDGPLPLQPEALPERADTPLWVCRNVLRSFDADLSVGIGALGGRRVTVRLRGS